jgi:hypothetical protein
MRIGGNDRQVVAGHRAWRKAPVTAAGTTAADAVAASAAWTANDTLTLIVVRYRTPFTTTYRLQFAGNRLLVRSEQNVGAADTRIAELEGRLADSSAAR